MLIATRTQAPSDSTVTWVTSSPLPDSAWGDAYSTVLLATSDAPPVAYSLPSGSLPPGLALIGDTIGGAPHPPPTAPVWDTPAGSLGTAAQGATFGLASRRGEAASFAVKAGTLPWGLTLDPATGALSGTAANVGGPLDDPGSPPKWVTKAGSLGSLPEGQAASFKLTAREAAVYTIPAGRLPWGLTLDPATGALSGTAANVGGGTWDPEAAPVWTLPASPDLGSHAVGDAARIPQTLDPASAASLFVSAGILPWGLTLDPASGEIGGTIGAQNSPGTYRFTVSAMSLAGDSRGQRLYSITIS